MMTSRMRTEVLGKNLLSATLYATNPTWTDLGANPDLWDESPATNRLSRGTLHSKTIQVHTDISLKKLPFSNYSFERNKKLSAL